MKQYLETTTMPKVNSVSPVSLSEGAYLHTQTAGAGLPALKAAIFSGGSGIFIGILMYRFWNDEWMFVTALASVAVFLIAFTITQRQWSRIAVGLIEMAIKKDLDGRNGIGNGLQPKPVEEVEKNLVINLRILDRDGTDTTYRQRLPISPEDMQIISEGIVYRKLSLSEANWTPKSKGKPFGDTEFKRIIKALRDAKYIRYVDPDHENLGNEPTRVGWVIFQKYATPPLDDLPDGFTRF